MNRSAPAFFFIFLICCKSVAGNFSFQLLSEPHSLDPALSRGSSGSYLLSNTYRSLFRYDTNMGLIPEGAKSCVYQNNKRILCELNPLIKWSNGKDIKAQQYVVAFQRILSPETKSPHSEFLLNLKNAKKILLGELPPQSLGVRAPSDHQLVFELDKEDSEFLYNLIYPALSPIYSPSFPKREDAHKLVVNGPYMFKTWTPGKLIHLVRNPHYPNQDYVYPSVEIMLIEEDSTALRVYESKKMSFLRRLSSSNIPKYKNTPGFFQVPVARFDYIGFGPQFRNDKNLRKALALSLNYIQLQNILMAKGRPGCPSLPSQLMSFTPCYNFDPKLAKLALKKSFTTLKNVKIHYSKLGGDDIAKSMEWVQHQWKKNLNINLELSPQEDGIYLRQLKHNPPEIFRKGISLDRPTCLAGVEIFEKDHSENYIKLNDPKFHKKLENLKKSTSEKNKKQYCSEIIKHLLDEYYIIPLGEIHFSMLENLEFTDWSINELNQLDLTHLKAKSSF